MKIGLVTLFPDAFLGLQEPKVSGLVGSAFKLKKAQLFIEDLREHGEGNHKVVDDSPYGGGDGMLLKPEPLKKALDAVLGKMDLKESDSVKVVFLSPSGRLWTQKKAQTWSNSGMNLVLICGRYAGADKRFIDECVDEEISIGPYVLNGGELPALCVIETMVRLLPEVLGNSESVIKDSFSDSESGSLVEAPSYTKPQDWRGRKVPEVLLSGDHKKISDYRERLSEQLSEVWREQAKKDLNIKE